MRHTLLPVKDFMETVTLLFEFHPHMDAIEGVPTATVSVFTGADPNPNSLLLMAPTVSKKGDVLQRVTGGVPGTTYEIIMAATSKDGDTIVMKAILPVGS